MQHTVVAIALIGLVLAASYSSSVNEDEVQALENELEEIRNVFLLWGKLKITLLREIFTIETLWKWRQRKENHNCHPILNSHLFESYATDYGQNTFFEVDLTQICLLAKTNLLAIWNTSGKIFFGFFEILDFLWPDEISKIAPIHRHFVSRPRRMGSTAVVTSIQEGWISRVLSFPSGGAQKRLPEVLSAVAAISQI